MRMFSKIVCGLAVAPLLALGATQAVAAPQILGVIASAGPIELRCDYRECGAQFTSYCLEQRRHSPDQGTPYYIHDTATVTLEGVREDGTVVALDVAGLLTVSTERGHSAIRMSVSKSILREFDLAAVRLSIGDNATLVPEAIAGDRRPHTEADIALAAGPLSALAKQVMMRGFTKIDAARVTASLINALPARGRTTELVRAAVWQEVSPDAATPGYELARQGFERCYDATFVGLSSLRQCLGSVHDKFISELNVNYWQSIETGS